MTFLFVLAAATATAAPPSPEVAQEIVVIGSRLKSWRGTWRKRKGILVCKTTKSTGDRGVDRVGCESLVACATPLVPMFDAIAAEKLPKTELNRRLNAAAQPLGACLAARRDAGVRALAESRAG